MAWVGSPQPVDKAVLGRFRIEIDWAEYFRAFSVKHGGDPLVIGNRLVFGDGWAYALHDHRGPEFPPPENPAEAAALRMAYWRRRQAVVRGEANRLRTWLKGWDEGQQLRDGNMEAMLKVVQWSRETTEEGRHKLKRTEYREGKPDQPSALQVIRDRLAWLESDLKNCDDKVREIEEGASREPEASARG